MDNREILVLGTVAAGTLALGWRVILKSAPRRDEQAVWNDRADMWATTAAIAGFFLGYLGSTAYPLLPSREDGAQVPPSVLYLSLLLGIWLPISVDKLTRNQLTLAMRSLIYPFSLAIGAVAVYGVIHIVNGALDASPRTSHMTTVNSRIRSGPKVHLSDWRAPGRDVVIGVDKRTYEFCEGGKTVKVVTGSGLLGLEWIVSISDPTANPQLVR